MKTLKLMPFLLILALLKLGVTGCYFFLIKQGKIALPSPVSKAYAEAQKSEQGSPFSCPEALYEALRLEKEQIAREKESLSKKQADLKLLEEQVLRRIAALESLEEEIDKKLNELRVIKTKRFKLLVGAYGNMKPSKAAKLLEAMEPNMAIKILSALKTEQVARILAAMPPEKAASLAEALSGLPPKEL
ncbi:MotE family protein [Thermodesulfatator atlanticus]|uniref:MotE family protein n=1 Tax=Thermodesulfatator atlanticus TaxID=501497 RepID=UPI0003B3280F|nr:hypothetical protein [Thermodesulfatator atlanticus]